MIKEKNIIVSLSSRNITHFDLLGYDIPKIKDKWGSLTTPRGTQLLVNVEDLPTGSKIPLTKICDMPHCKREVPKQPYKTIIQYRNLGDGLDRCFDCGRDKSALSNLNNLTFEKSLLGMSPKIAKELHPTKNKLTADKIANFSQVYAWWVCLNDNCKHEWRTRVSSRTVESTNCPVCTKRNRKGEGNSNWKNGITSLNHYLRHLLSEWRLLSLKKYNYRCYISGEIGKGDLDIHHTKPFNVIRDEVLNELGLKVCSTIGEYSTKELNKLTERFLNEHTIHEGVVIRGDLHSLFHHIYGWDDKVTILDLEEFKRSFEKGQFAHLQNENGVYSLPSEIGRKEESNVYDFMP